MSKLLFAGGRLESFVPIAGTLGESGDVNGTYSDTGIDTSGSVAGLTLTDPASAPLLVAYTCPAGHTLWFHAMCGTNYGFNNGLHPVIVFFDAANDPWFALAANGTFLWNSGTGSSVVWTNIGTSSVGWPGDNRGQSYFDIELAIDGSGNHTATLYVNNMIAVGPVGFTQPLLTGIQSIQIGNNGGGTDVVFSEVLCTEDKSTVGAHVITSRGNTAGTHTAWTGVVGDVNEAPVNDSNFNQATAAGLSQSYNMRNVTVPTGYEIAGVFSWFRAKQDGTAPTNIENLVITAAAVDHNSGSLPGLGMGYGSVGARYDENPDTSAAWTQADWNAPVQLGFTSAA